jgi:hypothetical protein
MLHARNQPASVYIGEMQRDAVPAGLPFTTGVRQIEDAVKAPGLKDAISDLESDCDASGHSFDW